MPSNVSICPLKSVTMTNSSQFETLMRMMSMQIASLRRFSDSLCRNSLVCKPIVAAAVCVAGLRRSGGEDAGCGGPGLVWLHVVCGCETGWMYCQFSEHALETAYGREMNIQFTGNSSGGHSCSQHVSTCSLKTCDIYGIVLCDKTAHFRVAFYCDQLRHTCAIIMLSNQHLDMTHLWGGLSQQSSAH